jgi:cell wall-associated NlpC family hydrolase
MNWSDITKKYIGTPYQWGGTKPSIGLDCLQFLISILESQGYAIDHYELVGELQIGLRNYLEISNHKLQNTLLLEWILKNSQEICMTEIKPGDIALCKYKNETIPGILDANGKVIICFLRYGVQLVSKMDISSVRRWK